MGCLAWGLPASAQASSSPSEFSDQPAEVIPGRGRSRKGANPGGLPTTYYFEYASVTCDEGCILIEDCEVGPLTGNAEQEVPAVEVTGLSGGVGKESDPTRRNQR